MLTSKGTPGNGRLIFSSEKYTFDFAGIKVKSNSDQTWLTPIKKKSFDDNELSSKLSFNFFNFDRQLEDENYLKEEDVSSTNISKRKNNFLPFE